MSYKKAKEEKNYSDYLEGQLFATQTAIRAIITSSPELNPLVTKELEKLISTALPREEISEAFLTGIESAKKRIFPKTS